MGISRIQNFPPSIFTRDSQVQISTTTITSTHYPSKSDAPIYLLPSPLPGSADCNIWDTVPSNFTNLYSIKDSDYEHKNLKIYPKLNLQGLSLWETVSWWWPPHFHTQRGDVSKYPLTWLPTMIKLCSQNPQKHNGKWLQLLQLRGDILHFSGGK